MESITCDGYHRNDSSLLKKRDVKAVTVGKSVLGYREIIRLSAQKPYDHFRGRNAEIEKIIRRRHGSIVPETDDAHIYADVIASLVFAEFGDEAVEPWVRAWCAKWMPWHDDDFIEEIIYDRLKVNYTFLTADAIAIRLNVSYAERCSLDLRTIGAYDVSKSKRAKIQAAKVKVRDCKRKEQARRANGQIKRSQYLTQSHSRQEPWKHFGCSRRTWERNGKPSPPSNR